MSTMSSKPAIVITGGFELAVKSVWQSSMQSLADDKNQMLEIWGHPTSASNYSKISYCIQNKAD